jgi:ERF superfamily
MKESATITQLAKALSKAQGSMGTAIKDSLNPHFRSRYADLASVWEACRQPLTSNGLSVIQPVSCDGVSVTVVTRLQHESGEFIEESMTLQAQQNTPQSIGSCVTYCRRYSLSSLVGIAPDDDDGNAASEVTRSNHSEAIASNDTYTVDPPDTVVNTHTGEEVPANESPEPPVGYYYLSDYAKRGQWHEFSVLRFAEDGSAMRFSTKFDATGDLAAQAYQMGIPVKVTFTPKKKGDSIVRGESYANSVHLWQPDVPPEPPVTLDEIPF